MKLTQEEDVLSDEGAIESTEYQRKFVLDCGCDAEGVGRCYECGAISCATCHGRCHLCQKPVCMEHSSFIENATPERMRLCNRCFSAINRKQKIKKVGRFFKSLVIQEDQNHER